MNNSLPQPPTLWCAGVSHHTAALALREALAVSAKQLPLLYKNLKEQFQFCELCVLVTCNRFEIYAVTQGSAAQEFRLSEVLQAVLEVTQRHSVPQRELLDHAFLFHGIAAVEHFFLVCSSLDSLVLGETQITGQVKTSLHLAKQCQSLGVSLTRLGIHGLRCAKAVRTQTGISKETVSISHAAIDLAKKVFGRLSERCFLLVGAGEMAETALRYALSYDPREVYVANRTLSAAQAMVDSLGHGTASPLAELKRLLLVADIVISSTGADSFVISYELLQEVMQERRRLGKGALFIVDIAVPRDVDPSCNELEDLYLFQIDDLEDAVAEGAQKRQKAAAQGRVLVAKQAAQFLRWLHDSSRRESLKVFRAYVEKRMHLEFEKSFRKQPLSALTQDEKDAVLRLQKAIGKRLVADMATLMEEIPEPDQQDLFAATLREGFEEDMQEGAVLDWQRKQGDQV
ncbi:MAG: glutamyl-tRNA reductase [Zetaproteobacteria bacterium]|nr:glutamyl-tRNA reductase [Zetaproteobacteria bacterium]